MTSTMPLSLPTGQYDGRTLSPWLRWTRWVWQGKVFTGDRVVNRIGPWRLVQGTVTADDRQVFIRYPGGLMDVLTPRPWGYRGALRVGPCRIRFELHRNRGLLTNP